MGSSGGQVVSWQLRNLVGEGRALQASLRRAGRWAGCPTFLAFEVVYFKG